MTTRMTKEVIQKPIEVPHGGTLRHVIEIGGREAVIMLRDYAGKASYDPKQTVFPEGVNISALDPWNHVQSGQPRLMTLTDIERKASVTFAWKVAKYQSRKGQGLDARLDAPLLHLRPLAGAIEARWSAIDGASTYILQWREKDAEDAEYMPMNTVHGGRRRVVVDIGPRTAAVFRFKARGKAWSPEKAATSLAWPKDPARRIDAYQSFAAESHWTAKTKPCWYDRASLVDVEIWYDDPDDDHAPLLFQRTTGLSPYSEISEYFWKSDIPTQLESWCAMADNGRSIAEVEIDRQAAALKQRESL